MSALTLTLLVFGVALLSSAVTCAVLWLYYRRVVQPALERQIETVIEALGEKVETRVRSGVVEGVTDLAASDTLRRTTQKVTSSGVALLDEGLNVLLGGGPRRPTGKK